MRWLKLLLWGLSAMLIVAMAAVYLIPLNTYVPKMEQVLEERLHEPVHIQDVRIAALPLPHLELYGVRIGAQEGVAAHSVSVEPDWFDLLAGKVVVRRILVRDGTANFALLRKLMGAFNKVSDAELPVAVREVQFSGMSLLTPEMTLGPIEGKLEFSQTGPLERVWLAMNEQRIWAVLLPMPGQRFSVKAQARAWAPPKFPQWVLDALQVEGVLSGQDFIVQEFSVALRGIRASGSGKVEFLDGWQITAALDQVDAPLEQVMALLEKPVELTGEASARGVLGSKAATLDKLKDNLEFSGEILINHATAYIAEGLQHPLEFDQIKVHVVAQRERLELNALEAKLYGGKLSGTASINRNNTVLSAKIAASQITMQSLVGALTNDVLFTGTMNSTMRFVMRLDAFERFPENLRLAADFHLRSGTLTKVDLAQAMNNPGKSNDKRGVTRFDSLTGLLDVTASGYHFSKLKISSGSLNAEGKVDISPSLQLNGTLDTEIKGTAGLVSAPMIVSGTLDEPVVRVSKTAWAGAAVGTVILGPGLGTALGMRIGGFLNKLFGKGDDKNDNKNDPLSLPENMPTMPPAKK